MFSHSTNCVGLFEMIEEVKLSEEEKWCWSASVRSARQNDITPRLTQPTRQNQDRHFSKKNYDGPVFDQHDHHAGAKKEEWTL